MSQPNRRSHLVVRRLIVVLVLLFVLISIASWIAWLIVHPLRPIFTIKSFAVSNFTLSADSRIKADYDVELCITNPNKKVSLVIDHFDIVLLYKAETIVTKLTWMEAVYLDKMGQQNPSLQFLRDFSHPLQGRDFKDISNDWSKRAVKFHVRMKIRTRFRSGIWPTMRNHINVSCMNLVVEFSAAEQTGKLKGGSKECSVHFA